MSQNVFGKIEEAPPPKRENDLIYVGDLKNGSLIRYIGRNGKWIVAGRVWPARAD